MTYNALEHFTFYSYVSKIWDINGFYMFDTNVMRCFYKVIVDNEAISKAPIVVFLLQSTDSVCHNWRFDDRENIFVQL